RGGGGGRAREGAAAHQGAGGGQLVDGEREAAHVGGGGGRGGNGRGRRRRRREHVPAGHGRQAGGGGADGRHLGVDGLVGGDAGVEEGELAPESVLGLTLDLHQLVDDVGGVEPRHQAVNARRHRFSLPGSSNRW